MIDQNIDIPAEWEHLIPDSVEGLIMVLGAPDSGKSTFASFLYERFCQVQGKVGFLDGDPGQSSLGPPTTISLGVNQPGETFFPPRGQMWRRFVASTSPSGHMLPVLVGATRLLSQAYQIGMKTIVYDTSGLVDPSQGGQALKYAKIDLLQPNTVFAIQREVELEPLLTTISRSGRTNVVVLKPSKAVVERDISTRQSYRQKKFAAYFKKAKPVKLEWNHYAITPAPRFAIHRLVALEDRYGFTMGLGIISDIDRGARCIEVFTPSVDLSGVRVIYLGDVRVDPQTFKDQHIS